MPIFLKENQSLKGNQYILPKDMKKHLNNTLHTYGAYTDAEGAKRLRSLVDKDYNNRSNINNDSFSFAELKRWNHELRHCDKSDDNLKYKLNGGNEALTYTNDLLRKERSKVKKQNAQNKVATRQLNSTKPTVKPTSTVKPTAADAISDEIKIESINNKQIHLTERQVHILKEYRNELTLPFDGNPNKENYLQFIDWLEEIGQYGKLPASSIDFEDFNNEKIVEYVTNFIQDDMGMYDDLVRNALTDIWFQFRDNIEDISELDSNTFGTELGYGNIDDVYDSLTSFGEDEFNKALEYNTKSEIEDFFSMCPLSFNDRNLVYIERAIEIPELLSKDINTHFIEDNEKDLYTFLLNHFRSSVGTCWSYTKGMSNIYSNGMYYQRGTTSAIVLHGYVDLKDADIPQTIALNLYDLKEEEEIRLIEGAKVEIFAITTIDGKKFPLRQSIIVQA